ncbi:MAG: glycosyltransferase [Gammaproteobacteria bacterium]|nr:glycosyltransferase [Gammaproteobacteria bacterium]
MTETSHGDRAPGLRVHMYVQHLLGRGHLARMRTLAAALARAGHRVKLISGGMPAAGDGGDAEVHAGYRVLQLPAVKVAAGNFRVLLGEDGAAVDDDFKARRATRLLQVVADDAPQVLVVESFPFGRRAMRFELLPLMEMVAAMQPRPLTLCSVRDILQPRDGARDRQTVDEVVQWFDAVLVHADPAVAKLDETFSLTEELRGRFFYTGYVHESAGAAAGDASPKTPPAHGAVVVSAGGGAVGFELLKTAVAARPLSALKHRPWHLLVGRSAAAAEFDALAECAGDGITVQWARADFAALLAACAVSVSQAGYNTVLDTAAAGCGAVFVPYSRHGEAEQLRRAEKFAALGRAVTVAEEDLDAARLAAAIDRAARLDLSTCAPIRMDGAAQTLDFIERRARG